MTGGILRKIGDIEATEEVFVSLFGCVTAVIFFCIANIGVYIIDQSQKQQLETEKMTLLKEESKEIKILQVSR